MNIALDWRSVGLHLLLTGGLFVGAIGCGAARLEEAETAPAVVATVVAAPTPPPNVQPSDSHVTAAGTEPDSPAPSSLAGTWSEEFESRFGCQDIIEIRPSPSGLRLSGVDCNDGEDYDFREASFDGSTLRVRVIVPSTKYNLRYRLEVRSVDELEGEVEVDGGGNSTTYQVKWVRASDP